MTDLSEFLAAAREMRDAAAAKAAADFCDSGDYDAIVKAAEAAKAHFESLAAGLALAAAITALHPALAFRSAADAVALASHRSNAPAIRSLLGDLPWPGTLPEAIARYGDGTLALEVWGLVAPVVGFAAAWGPFLAAAMPVVGERARTMEP